MENIASKRLGVLSLIVVTLVALIGVVYFFGFRQALNEDVPPTLVGDVSGLQGFIGEDVGVTVDGIFKNYEFLGFDANDVDLFDEAKADFEASGVPAIPLNTTSANQGLHYVYSNEDTTLENILRAIDPVSEAVAVATYDAEIDQFAITPNTYYQNTEEVTINDFDEYEIAAGQAVYIISFKSTSVYSLHSGTEFATEQFDICAETEDGWYNFALTSEFDDNLLALFEDCINDVEQVWAQTTVNPTEFERVYQNSSNGVDPLSKLTEYETNLSLVWVKIGDVEEPVNTNLGPVQNLAANIADNGNVTVSWNNPANTDPANLDSYVVDVKLPLGLIQIDLDSEKAVSAANPQQEISSTNLSVANHGEAVQFTLVNFNFLPATKQDVTVYAVDNAGNEGAPATTSFTTPGQSSADDEGGADVKPEAPSNVVTTPGDKKLTISWTAPTETGDSPIKNYLLRCGPQSNPSLITTQTTNTSVEFPQLANGTEYFCTVQTQNEDGDLSDPVQTGGTPTAPTPAALAQPSQLKGFQLVDYNYGTNEIVLQWDAPVVAEEVTSYNLAAVDINLNAVSIAFVEPQQSCASATTACHWTEQVQQNGKWVVRSHLKNMPRAARYLVSISAVNSAGASNVALLPELVDVPPYTPTNITGSYNYESKIVNLRWDIPAEINRIDEYKILHTIKNPSGVITKTLILHDEPISQTPYYVSSPGANQIVATLFNIASDGFEHTFKVIAVSDAGSDTSGDLSPLESLESTELSRPAAVTNLEFTENTPVGGVQFGSAVGWLEWDNPATPAGQPITGYKVYYRLNSTGGVHTELSQQSSSNQPYIQINAEGNHVTALLYNIDADDLLGFAVQAIGQIEGSYYTQFGN